MVFDRKKVTLAILLSAVIIAVIVYTRREQQSNDVTADVGWLTDPTLKFVAVVFRHGDRTPTFQFKTNPHSNAFPEGKGELTKKGKQHMYKKGQTFRRMYNGFISDLYLDSEIIIKTTYMRRTFMSAQMVLAGMYPPKDYQKWSDLETIWQPIPVYNSSPDHGTLFINRESCPLFYSISHKKINKFHNNANNNITEPLLLYLSEKCEQPITINNLIQLYDLFVCQISDGLQLPEWIKPYQIQIIKSIVLNRTNLQEFYGHPTLQKLIVGPLLNEIGSAMELHLNNSNYNITRKMHLYAGHDISIIAIMSFFRNFIDMPNFGSSLHFHLYYDETNGYTIKVFYYNQWDNVKGEEVSMPLCDNPCKFHDFIKLITDNMSGKWEDECQKVETES